jgi:hypothetical protein
MTPAVTKMLMTILTMEMAKDALDSFNEVAVSVDDFLCASKARMRAHKPKGETMRAAIDSAMRPMYDWLLYTLTVKFICCK